MALPISSSVFMALSPFTTPPNDTRLGRASLWWEQSADHQDFISFLNFIFLKRHSYIFSWCGSTFVEHAHPVTDSGSSMKTLALTLTGLRFFCSLVLLHKRDKKTVTHSSQTGEFLSCVQECSGANVWSSSSMSMSVVSSGIALALRMMWNVVWLDK